MVKKLYPGQRPADWKAPDGQASPNGLSGCVKIPLIVLGGIFGLGLLGTIITPSKPENKGAPTADKAIPVPTTNTSTSDSESASMGQWSYSESEDKLRGKSDYFASLNSINQIHQDFPYEDQTSAQLTIRKAASGRTDVVFQVSSGQLMCPSYQGCSGTVRFDDGAPQKLRFLGPEDNSNETIFVADAKRFIENLKKSKRLVIEKTMYQAGSPQFEFNTVGLKWDH